jgi:hypothetical protein
VPNGGSSVPNERADGADRADGGGEDSLNGTLKSAGGGRAAEEGAKEEATLWLYHDNPHWHAVCSKALVQRGGEVEQGMEVLLETKSAPKGVKATVLMMLGRVYATHDLFVPQSAKANGAAATAAAAAAATAVSVGGTVGNERGGYLLKVGGLVGFGDVKVLHSHTWTRRHSHPHTSHITYHSTYVTPPMLLHLCHSTYVTLHRHCQGVVGMSGGSASWMWRWTQGGSMHWRCCPPVQ